ncbi:hypothetical protein Syun_029409 [Stephania yunnanensis]|uniref:Uncharacterized protein n=1 Tax=Stephania yunnanensis TaxID=152371 RepID=A0AAP0HLC4_9MAGN
MTIYLLLHTLCPNLRMLFVGSRAPTMRDGAQIVIDVDMGHTGELITGNLRLSGYSACGQDGGVQLPREYVEEGVSNADLVLLVTTRPTTGNTLAWAVACERDQWGRAIAGLVNVAPRHLTAEAQTLGWSLTQNNNNIHIQS